MRRYFQRQNVTFERWVIQPIALAIVWTFAVAAAGVGWSVAQEARWGKPSATVEVPKAPSDAVAAKIYTVFDRHCASCHQTGRTTLGTPAGSFGHVLDLETIAADAGLVRPGAPDASPLYTMLQSAPAHGLDATKDIELTSGDLDALRDWISALKPVTRCERRPVGREETASAISRYLASAGADAKSSRFLMLSHLYNACASGAEMKAYREATAIAVNSLSWGLKPIVLTPVDEAETVFRIDLSAMGWDEGRWSRLLSTYPYRGIEPDSPTDTVPSAVRADWFVVAGLSPPLYYELLGLPDRLSTLTASLRVDLAADVAQNRARRVGIKSSPVARGSRLLQRSTFANGGFWMTYEYAPTPGRPDLFEAPGGPGIRGASRSDASLVMFALPSGFNAFFMTNADGVRVNELPLSVVRNDTHPGRRLTAGGGCLGCHNLGPRAASDELRARVLGDTGVPRDIREKTLSLAAGDEEMKPLIAADIGRASGALAEAGTVPGATLDGVDLVGALSHRYERDVSIDALASELGVSTIRLRETAGKAQGLAGDIIERIVHGPVPRSSVEAAFGQLAAAVKDGLVAPVEPVRVSEPASDDVPQRLVLKTGPAMFKVGETLFVTARATESCYLTLINVDRNGRGTVVFPNDFEQNNFLEAGKDIRVPANGAPYLFRLREAGRETIVGICQTGSKTLPGIRHEFERQRFTELGDYKSFLARLNLAESDGRPQAQVKVATEQRTRRRGRTATPTVPPAVPPSGRIEVQMRAAAIVDVVP